MDSDTLLDVGFIEVGLWRRAADGRGIELSLDGPNQTSNSLLLTSPKALYAFADRDGKVLYIGKTAQSVRQRFTGYCRPHAGQRTNWRCHHKILELLDNSRDVRVLVFPTTGQVAHLRYSVFEINLAAGLEDALIAAFNPPWNGHDRGRPITEDAEREKEVEPVPEDAAEPATPASTPSGHPFLIKLGDTYLNHGTLNPGVEASPFIGAHDEPMTVMLGSPDNLIVSRIDRRAIRSGAARIVGRNRIIADWYADQGFVLGDIVSGEVIGPNAILLRAKNEPG